MSRSERLINLLQLLRQNRRPVTGQILAQTLNISLRSLYRDIASLQAQGAQIEGEAGLGYILRPGYLLPPLMFSEDELEALTLGSLWVGKQHDEGLSQAAKSALAKIAAVLPPKIYENFENPALVAGPTKQGEAGFDTGIVRRSIREQTKLVIDYRDIKGSATSRAIWPIAIGFFDDCRLVVAWCELRQSFRHFRCDRIVKAWSDGTRYPRPRYHLLREWRERQKLASS